MAEAKHTSGPWLRTGTTVYALMHEGLRRGTEEFKNRFTALVQGDRECPSAEVEANARLIAAAPDLLAALLPFVNATLTNHGSVIGLMREDFEHARAAIDRATGVSHE